ncbi:hypothetical protein GQ53DRAFT_402816 [Thozetella sp. PMI_491]|nr:hypothetical protein GQ53DRAFT_402816 [Thozetella sp. PMI_491]
MKALLTDIDPREHAQRAAVQRSHGSRPSLPRRDCSRQPRLSCAHPQRRHYHRGRGRRPPSRVRRHLIDPDPRGGHHCVLQGLRREPGPRCREYRRKTAPCLSAESADLLTCILLAGLP